jgi:hypothetical protein
VVWLGRAGVGVNTLEASGRNLSLSILFVCFPAFASSSCFQSEYKLVVCIPLPGFDLVLSTIQVCFGANLCGASNWFASSLQLLHRRQFIHMKDFSFGKFYASDVWESLCLKLIYCSLPTISGGGIITELIYK